jgi:hypothetical protein
VFQALAAAGLASPAVANPAPADVPSASPASLTQAAGARVAGAGIPAQDPHGFYASVGLGATWPQPVHYADDRLGPLLPIEGTLLADPGLASDLGLGYDFGRLRAELSWVRRQATIVSSGWSVGPYPAAASVEDPQLRSNSVFAGLYLDLPVPQTRLVPYVGAGLGITALQASATTIQLGRFRSSFGGGSGESLGYEAKAGLAWRSSPRTDLFAEAVYQGAPGNSQGSLDRSALNSWGLRLGLRLRFAGPVSVLRAGTAAEPSAAESSAAAR